MENITETGIVEKIVNGGFGLIRSEHGTVFLKYVIPGEEVVYRVKEKAKGILWGEVLKIKKHFPNRIIPKCPYYGECGGCILSHMKYDNQLRIKKGILTDDLRKIGNIDMDSINVIGSPEFSYRIRAKLKGLKNGKIGFIRRGTNDVMEIDSCMLVTPEMNNFINKWNSAEEMQFFHQIDLFFNSTEKKLYVHVTGEPDKDTVDKFSIFGDTDFSWKGNRETNNSVLRIGEYTYHVAPDNFFQVNKFQWENMLNKVDSWMETSDLSLDIYTGSGFFIPVLLKYSKRVIGIENSKISVKLAKRSFKNAEFVRSPVEKFLFNSADTIIVDPPRSGIPGITIEKIFKANPSTVIYISCSSATLARDLKKFVHNNFNIKEMVMLDLFPQTAHLETMTLLKKNDTKTR